MTTVTSSTSTAQSSSSVSQSGLMANYELFLSILTTQIQNQDPLDPLDSAEYTTQLVQYSNVEQSIQQNRNLESIIASLETTQSMGYVSYIGNEITADGSTTTLSGGQASWNYALDEDASGTYEIRNSSGTVVYSGEADLSAGNHTFTWDGKTENGQNADSGLYTISFDMQDSGSNTEFVDTSVKGIVDAVDWSSGEAILIVDGREFPVSAVQSVARPS
ncbi:flagellar hook assembly protein FlgD [Roseibium aggregatum]|uniref:Basal-body rod modification protein FlgD n=1 Tax=Roseibium aggregatum TaxID=187304 RepID=A0A939ELC9_9HYPH|nr:flagellar hook capping FlgD N-terminal domain-containing protein [Roseibium aggregatum]MBN9673690.1 flagellar hook assembly protein FlgD [Roseibium aggregatum]